jgi:hypothetical protein
MRTGIFIFGNWIELIYKLNNFNYRLIMRKLLFNKQLFQLHIVVKETPNPLFMKFVTGGQNVIRAGSYEFTRKEQTIVSPLAEKIFEVGNVTRVFFGLNYISVAVEEESMWGEREKQVTQVISQHFDLKLPVFTQEVNNTQAHDPNDSEVV